MCVCVCEEQLNYLLSKVRPVITEQDIFMREALLLI
jgi:hypothetical protein